ncbi:glycosyltransferase family 4 protein [Pelagicoccus albus]|uniref:Glycosyltransferase family 4 protein n=1 Tax=Pelagicoccus albus TaxID=415222 RepID=A0A7X1E9V4_9BACT|nr:glycosyltransferase family 4 protein [Pelagicoccus albus]MBC2608240.1 glycosyltransferase family 4 protein [Pelagicoccus albus]
MASTGKGNGRKVLIIVENLPCPFDRRVWQEANTLKENGYTVSIICPTGKGHNEKFERLNDIDIYRHNLPIEGDGALGYAIEYSTALFWQFVLSLKVLFRTGFDVIHACNPPDNIFLIGGFFKLFGKKYLFDHHDINPELYEAKFGKRGFFYDLMIWSERLSYGTADIAISTNESYKEIAIKRGKMPEDKVFVVRSGPKLDRLKICPPKPELKKGKAYMIGYIGVMGAQEGIDHLLEAAKHMIFEMGRKDVHFGIIGGGTALEGMKALAIEMGIGEHVTFTGRVPDDEMLDMLNTADVCVNPDVANEMNDKSTMNKIMEYMALAKPIVQYDLKEGRFSAQEASLYAKPNDRIDLAEKIVELLDDPERRQKMGEFGRNRVLNELQWQYEEPKLLNAYETLFSGKK